MRKLSAIITAFYLHHASSSMAFAAGGAHGGSDAHSTHALPSEGVMAEHGEYNHYGEAHGDTAHHGADHASSGGLPQFDPTWFASQMFWLAVMFAILYVVFARKTLPDISAVIENRKNHIESDLETAEKLTAEADQVHDAYHANLEKAQGEAANAIQKIDDEMKAKSAQAFDDYRERSETEIQAVESRILTAKNQAMGDMNAIAAEVASVAVEKIINKKANPTQIQSLIDGMSKKAKKAA